jgi:hypothetical protein
MAGVLVLRWFMAVAGLGDSRKIDFYLHLIGISG